jgi:site-specific DNA-methyltransferase (adenine-specific)
MRSVWSIPAAKKSEKVSGKHPAQKPLNLLNRIILASTIENSVILDPFCGSGTTGAACKCFNDRFFIGIEIDKCFCRTIRKRLSG